MERKAENMNAAVIDDTLELAVKQVPLPTVKDGFALIRVLYSGICGTDVSIVKGEYAAANFPLIPGHEFVGELVEAKGASSLEIGDLVVAHPVISCGNCKACASGRDNVCEHLNILGCQTSGSFSQYVIVPIHKVYALPKSTNPQIAALVEPLAVAVHDVHTSGIQVGDNALIIGGGPIGLLIALVARQAGATNMVVSEINLERRKFAQNMGFTALDPLDTNFSADLEKITSGKGFDVVFEVSGNKTAFDTAVEQTRIAGTIMVVGLSKSLFEFSSTKVVQRELSIKGVRVHSQKNFMAAVNLLKSGIISKDLEKFISNVFDLNNINEAFDYLKNNQDALKILIKTN